MESQMEERKKKVMAIQEKFKADMAKMQQKQAPTI